MYALAGLGILAVLLDVPKILTLRRLSAKILTLPLAAVVLVAAAGTPSHVLVQDR